MSDTGVKISELEECATVFDGCCLPIVTLGETKKLTYALLKRRLAEDLGIINVVLTETLAAGDTQVTFEYFRFTEDVLLEIYTDKFGVDPVNIDDSVSGKITLTFPEQEEDVTIKILVRNEGV